MAGVILSQKRAPSRLKKKGSSCEKENIDTLSVSGKSAELRAPLSGITNGRAGDQALARSDSLPRIAKTDTQETDEASEGAVGTDRAADDKIEVVIFTSPPRNIATNATTLDVKTSLADKQEDHRRAPLKEEGSSAAPRGVFAGGVRMSRRPKAAAQSSQKSAPSSSQAASEVAGGQSQRAPDTAVGLSQKAEDTEVPVAALANSPSEKRKRRRTDSGSDHDVTSGRKPSQRAKRRAETTDRAVEAGAPRPKRKQQSSSASGDPVNEEVGAPTSTRVAAGDNGVSKPPRPPHPANTRKRVKHDIVAAALARQENPSSQAAAGSDVGTCSGEARVVHDASGGAAAVELSRVEVSGAGSGGQDTKRAGGGTESASGRRTSPRKVAAAAAVRNDGVGTERQSSLQQEATAIASGVATSRDKSKSSPRAAVGAHAARKQRLKRSRQDTTAPPQTRVSPRRLANAHATNAKDPMEGARSRGVGDSASVDNSATGDEGADHRAESTTTSKHLGGALRRTTLRDRMKQNRAEEQEMFASLQLARACDVRDELSVTEGGAMPRDSAANPDDDDDLRARPRDVAPAATLTEVLVTSSPATPSRPTAPPAEASPPRSPAACLVCHRSLAHLGERARAAHVNACLDRAGAGAEHTEQTEDMVLNGGGGESFRCAVCHRDITHLTNARRITHMNRCCDRQEEEAGPVQKLPPVCESPAQTTPTNARSSSGGITSDTWMCPICSRQLDDAAFSKRVNHLKACGQSYGVGPAEMRSLLQASKRRRDPSPVTTTRPSSAHAGTDQQAAREGVAAAEAAAVREGGGFMPEGEPPVAAREAGQGENDFASNAMANGDRAETQCRTVNALACETTPAKQPGSRPATPAGGRSSPLDGQQTFLHLASTGRMAYSLLPDLSHFRYVGAGATRGGSALRKPAKKTAVEPAGASDATRAGGGDAAGAAPVAGKTVGARLRAAKRLAALRNQRTSQDEFKAPSATKKRTARVSGGKRAPKDESLGLALALSASLMESLGQRSDTMIVAETPGDENNRTSHREFISRHSETAQRLFAAMYGPGGDDDEISSTPAIAPSALGAPTTTTTATTATTTTVAITAPDHAGGAARIRAPSRVVSRGFGAVSPALSTGSGEGRRSLWALSAAEYVPGAYDTCVLPTPSPLGDGEAEEGEAPVSPFRPAPSLSWLPPAASDTTTATTATTAIISTAIASAATCLTTTASATTTSTTATTSALATAPAAPTTASSLSNILEPAPPNVPALVRRSSSPPRLSSAAPAAATPSPSRRPFPASSVSPRRHVTANQPFSSPLRAVPSPRRTATPSGFSLTVASPLRGAPPTPPHRSSQQAIPRTPESLLSQPASPSAFASLRDLCAMAENDNEIANTGEDGSMSSGDQRRDSMREQLGGVVISESVVGSDSWLSSQRVAESSDILLRHVDSQQNKANASGPMGPSFVDTSGVVLTEVRRVRAECDDRVAALRAQIASLEVEVVRTRSSCEARVAELLRSCGDSSLVENGVISIDRPLSAQRHRGDDADSENSRDARKSAERVVVSTALGISTASAMLVYDGSAGEHRRGSSLQPPSAWDLPKNDVLKRANSETRGRERERLVSDVVSLLSDPPEPENHCGDVSLGGDPLLLLSTSPQPLSHAVEGYRSAWSNPKSKTATSAGVDSPFAHALTKSSALPRVPLQGDGGRPNLILDESSIVDPSGLVTEQPHLGTCEKRDRTVAKKIVDESPPSRPPRSSVTSVSDSAGGMGTHLISQSGRRTSSPAEHICSPAVVPASDSDRDDEHNNNGAADDDDEDDFIAPTPAPLGWLPSRSASLAANTGGSTAGAPAVDGGGGDGLGVSPAVVEGEDGTLTQGWMDEEEAQSARKTDRSSILDLCTSPARPGTQQGAISIPSSGEAHDLSTPPGALLVYDPDSLVSSGQSLAKEVDGPAVGFSPRGGVISLVEKPPTRAVPRARPARSVSPVWDLAATPPRRAPAARLPESSEDDDDAPIVCTQPATRKRIFSAESDDEDDCIPSTAPARTPVRPPAKRQRIDDPLKSTTTTATATTTTTTSTTTATSDALAAAVESATEPVPKKKRAPRKPRAEKIAAPATGVAGEEPKYEEWTKEELQTELDRYGVKAGGRNYMVAKLHSLWRAINMPETLVMPPAPAPRPPPRAAEASGPAQAVAAAAELLDRAQEAASGDATRGDEGGVRSAPLPEEPRAVVLAQEARIYQYIKTHRELYERVLLFEAIDPVALQEQMRADDVTVSNTVLVNFLEEQGITYRFPKKKPFFAQQNAKKAYRGRK